MPQQARFDVFELERGVEQRVVLQVDLPDRKEIRRAPVACIFCMVSGVRGSDMASLSRGRCC